MSARRWLLFLAFLLAGLSPVGRAEEPPALATAVRLVVQPTTPAWLVSLLGEARGMRLNPVSGRPPDLMAGNESRFRISPDGRRVAYVSASGRQACVVVDGKPGKAYDGILGGTLTFSPDGARIAYGARAGDKSFVVLDGQAGKTYDAILAGTVVFSPDGRRLAYGARLGEKSLVIVDGEEGRQYEAILQSTLAFSGDGKRVAYGVKAGGRSFVVVNGREGTAYDAILEGTLSFGAAGRLAYGAAAGDKAVVVVTGRPAQKFDGIIKGTPVFSPHGRRLACAVRLGARFQAVVDGKPGQPYEAIEEGSLVFSPDGGRLAYVAGEGGRRFLVADGGEGERYDAILGVPVFSPDGKHLACLARLGNMAFAVLDGQPQKSYDAVAPGSLRYSADGSRLAYIARSGDRWLVVDGGNEQRGYDYIGGLAFGPGGGGPVYAAVSAGQWRVVADGVETAGFDGILTIAGAGVVFDSPADYHYLGIGGGRLYLAGNNPQVPADPELEKAVAELRHVRLENLAPLEKWRKTQEIDRAWAVIQARGERGQTRVIREIELARAAGEKDDFFFLNAGALLWRLGGLDAAGVIAEIWRVTPAANLYEYLFTPAFAAAQTQDPRALPMLLACLRETGGQLRLGEHGFNLTWPLTQEFIWGVYGAPGLPALMDILAAPGEANELQSAMLVLTGRMYQPALPRIRSYARDPRSAVRRAALVCLGKYGHPQDYDLLVAGLGRGAEDLLFRIYALGFYGDLRAAPALAELLRTKDDALGQARMAAIDALKTLLSSVSLEALRQHAKSAENPAEQRVCQDFLTYFLGQIGSPSWEQFDRQPKAAREEAIARFRNRDYALKDGERPLSRAELATVIEEWRKSRSIAASSSGWVSLRHLLPVATKDDLPALFAARAAIYTRLSDGCLADVAAIDRIIQYLARREYRREAGITWQAEGI